MYGAILSAPIAINSALGHLSLENVAAAAAYKTKPAALGAQFVAGFSRAAIALSAGVVRPALNELEQSRNNAELLTRVPKIPLYVLIGLKAVYALACVALAALAFLVTGLREAQEVKARLTFDGLAVGLFEPGASQARAVEQIEHLYDEHRGRDSRGAVGGTGEEAGSTKVGVRKTEAGGWIWVASGKVQKAWTALGVGDMLGAVVDDVAAGGRMGALGTDYETLKKIM